MSQEAQIFVPKYAKDIKTFNYLGSDGLPTIKTYNLYLTKCDEFKAKARKYAKDNLYLKQSILHHSKIGYESSQELEEEVLLEREEHMKQYKKAFNITLFDEDSNSMYECFSGRSKKIRIIRDFKEVGKEEFSDDFENKKATWFTRYCILSRFIQCVRKIILINRLNKALALLRIFRLETTKNDKKLSLEASDEKLNEEVEKKTFCQNIAVLFENIK